MSELQTIELNVPQNFDAASNQLLSSGMLTAQDAKALVGLSEELIQTWETRQIFRTETEMRASVLNHGDHPTPAARYWQAVREQHVMMEQLILMGFEYRRNELRARRLEAKLEATTDEFDREEIRIDLDECAFKRAAMQQVAHDRAREIKLWSTLKAEQVQADGTFDTTDVNIGQLEILRERLLHRKQALTPGCSQGEVTNVLGPLQTVEYYLKKAKAEKSLPQQ